MDTKEQHVTNHLMSKGLAAVDTADPGTELADPLQFAAACQKYLDQVWRQLRAMGVWEGHLDDATQEVFLLAHAKWPAFEHRSQVSTWLYAIAYRVGCNYRRRVKRSRDEEFVETEHSAHGDPEQALGDKRAAALVQGFCDGLSEKLRDVFILALLEEQSTPTVARILELPENTVYSRIRLVRQAFRQMLEESGMT